jgi:quercetin dioxygenase-like cupin family protein
MLEAALFISHRFPTGPRVEILVDEHLTDSGRFAVARVLIPPGGSIPEHDHGEAEALVVVQTGQVLIRSGDQQATLEPGMLVALKVGEGVRLDNVASEPVSLLAFFAPASFIQTLAAWPLAPQAANLSADEA